MRVRAPGRRPDRIRQTANPAALISVSDSEENPMATVATRTYQLLINGQWRDSRSSKFVENRNPARIQEILGLVPLASLDEVDEAVDAAREAFPAWRRKPAPQRGTIIARAAEIMTRRKEELARALTQEEGKILRESRGEVQRSINVLEYMAGESRRLGG